MRYISGRRGSPYFTLLKRIVAPCGRLFETRVEGYSHGSLKFDVDSAWINFFLPRHRNNNDLMILVQFSS